MQISRSVLLVLSAMVAFGMMALFTREANAPVLTIAAWRAIVVAIVFGIWTAVQEGGAAALKADRATLRIAIPYGIALAVASSTFVGGYAMTTVANTIFLHNLAPVVAFPLAWWLFKERPEASAVAGAGVALLGVAMLSGVSLFHFTHFTNPRFLLGDLLSLASAVGYAAVLVQTRAARQAGVPLLGTLFVAWTVAAILIAGVTLVFGTLSISPAALVWVIGLAIICTNLPFYLLNQGMKEVSAGMASLLSMAEVVFATLLGVLLYHEQLAPIGWMGGALVGFGILYPFFAPTPSQDEPANNTPMPLTDPTSAQMRWGRLLICLFLLNAGAALALLRGLGAGALLAWIGAAGLLRLGPPAVLQLMEGRYPNAIRWGSAILSALLILGVVFRGGWQVDSPGLMAAAVAMVILIADVVLAQGEGSSDQDMAHPLHMALGLVVLAQVAGWAVHPGEQWLQAIAAMFTAMTVWSTLMGAMHGTGRWWERSRGLDAVAIKLSQPTWAVGGLAVVWGLGGLSIVPAGHQAVVERFGAARPQPATAGLLLHLPPPIERIHVLNVAQFRQLDVVNADTALLCGDQSMVSLSASLHYTVTDAHRYLYAAIDPDAALQDETRAALTSVIGRLPQDAVLTDQRAEVEAAVLQLTQQRVAQAGLGVLPEALHLTSVAVPPPVMDAFLDVISADEERSTLINQAEAYAAAVIPEALGEAAATHQRALGEADLIAAEAAGWMLRFDALSTGGAAAPGLTRHRLRQEDMVERLADNPLMVTTPNIEVWKGGMPPQPTQQGEP